MSTKRFVGLSALLSAAAVVAPAAAQDPTPERGPRGSIHASFIGGSMYRQLRASFRADKRGYAMVGQVRYDGRITVLFPETPRESGRIEAKKTYQVRPVDAYSRAAQFNYASHAYRTASARFDSYDGSGSAFIFLITSSRPMDLDALVGDDGEWSENYIEDYTSMSDPRLAVADFARSIADRWSYSIKYASSFGTHTGRPASFVMSPMNFCSGVLFGSAMGLVPFGYGFDSWAPFGYGMHGMSPVFYAGGFYFDASGPCFRNARHYAIGTGWRHYTYDFYPRPTRVTRVIQLKAVAGGAAHSETAAIGNAVERKHAIVSSPASERRPVDVPRSWRTQNARSAAREAFLRNQDSDGRAVSSRLAPPRVDNEARPQRLGTPERSVMRGRAGDIGAGTRGAAPTTPRLGTTAGRPRPNNP